MRLSRFNAVDIERVLRTEKWAPPFPVGDDREGWEKLKRSIGEAEVRRLLDEAERAAEAEIPHLPASLYLEFKRIGERAGYQTPRHVRRTNHSALVLGECLEYEGRFLDPLMDLTWAICEESSWAVPAHQTELADLDFPIVDLHSSMTGAHLAEMDLLLGKTLDPRVGKRIRDEVDRRLLVPYLTRHDHWWMHNTDLRGVNNWSGVCNGNVVVAALYLEEDPERLAEIIARAARSLDDYLDTYDVDGGSSEGPGPWIFGFSHFAMLGHLLEHRSNGKLAFMDGDFIRKIAAFPLKTVMTPDQWVNFADTESHTTFPEGYLLYAAERLDLPDLATLYHEQRQRGINVAREGELPWLLRSLFWRPEEMPADPVRFIPNRHDFYGGMHWMFARVDPENPDALVLAAKGGHNGEMHNQNDVGSFIVQINQEQVIADIGRGRFTRAYFGAKRYEDISCQSIGHSCPVVNGWMQGPLTAPERLGDGNVAEVSDDQRGELFAATLVEHRADDEIDLMKIELKDVYPKEAQLESLVRTIAMHRDVPEGRVEVIDEVALSEPGTYESVLTTFGAVEVQDGVVTIRGEEAAVRISYDQDEVQARVDLRKDVSLTSGVRDVRRVVFSWGEKRREGVVRLGTEVE